METRDRVAIPTTFISKAPEKTDLTPFSRSFLHRKVKDSTDAHRVIIDLLDIYVYT